MTRDKHGSKCFSDHDIGSISDYLAQATLIKYSKLDTLISSKNLFHCKLARKSLNIENHMFGYTDTNFSSVDLAQITCKIQLQINELFAQQ